VQCCKGIAFYTGKARHLLCQYNKQGKTKERQGILESALPFPLVEFDRNYTISCNNGIEYKQQTRQDKGKQNGKQGKARQSKK
jgi:hypothetical protein